MQQQLPAGPGKDFDRLTPVMPVAALYSIAKMTDEPRPPTGAMAPGMAPHQWMARARAGAQNSGLAAAPLSVIPGERASSRGLSEDRRY